MKLDSLSGHCCFEATVLDTEDDEWVCECFDPEHAERIAKLLNKEEDR